MIFRNSFQILINNFSKIFKLLLYHLILVLFLGAIFLAFFIPNFSSFMNGLMDSDVPDYFRQLGGAIIGVFLSSEGAEEAVRESIFGLGQSFGAFITAHTGSIVLVIVLTVLVVLVYEFLKGIGEFVVGDMINTKMGSYADVNFTPSLVRNLGNASKFFLIYVPLSLLLDILILAICYFVFFFVLSFLPGFIAVFFTVTIIFSTQAVKLTIISDLMPCMIEGGMKIKDSLKNGLLLGGYKFGRLFATYLVYVYIVAIVNFVAAVATLGSGLLITLPISTIWLLSIRFVNYYTVTGRKYFITYDTIVLNADKGETERFFENNEMYDKTKTR